MTGHVFLVDFLSASLFLLAPLHIRLHRYFSRSLLFLEDPALLDVARQGLDQRRINAEVCWQLAVDQFVDAYGALEDPYLQARATDLVDVGKRVLRQLVGEHPVALEFSQPCILVASDLTPSDLVQLDPDEVLGICTSLGGATSHSAILARALGIPAVVGIGPAILQVANETLLGLDGERGQMCINPPDVQTWQKRRESWLAARQAVRRASGQPAVTADGHRVEVMANIRGPADVRLALECGAEGVGLLRTEFLFLERADAPSEEEQQAAYQAIATALGQRPLERVGLYSK